MKYSVIPGPSLNQLAVVPLKRPSGPSDFSVFINTSKGDLYLLSEIEGRLADIVLF